MLYFFLTITPISLQREAMCSEHVLISVLQLFQTSYISGHLITELTDAVSFVHLINTYG